MWSSMKIPLSTKYWHSENKLIILKTHFDVFISSALFEIFILQFVDVLIINGYSAQELNPTESVNVTLSTVIQL